VLGSIHPEEDRMTAAIPETFGRVLRRTDRDVRLAANMRFSSYDVSLAAVAVEHPDGVQALTLFFPVGKDSAAHRATRLGWVDVTDEWTKPKPSAPVAAAVEEAPSQVADRASMAPTEEALRKMTWSALRTLAKDRSVSARGSREDVEAAVLASFEG
jgi:hypothetical protein